jgi:hypothetical protein
MLTTRNSLPTFAVVASLVAAGTTAAQAGGRFFPFPLCHGLGSIGKPSGSHKVASPRAADDDEPASKRAQKSRPAPEPAAVVVQRLRRAAEPPVTVAQRPRPAAEPPAIAATNVAFSPAATATTTCLRKEYLDTGAVMFRDVCTNEWAINSTDVNNKMSSIGRACLTKSADPGGIVMFKDTCTNEWAMNTSEQQFQAPQTR